MEPVPAKHRFATITMDARTFPAIVIDWKKVADAQGYEMWHARCLYWDDEPKVALVPEPRVRKVG